MKTQITKLKGGLRETENRAEKWIELTEKTFNFATYARKEFVLGGLDKKREIFAALGQNFLVKDKEVSIEASEWLVPIEKAYPALEAEYKRLELDKNLTDTKRNAAFRHWRPALPPPPHRGQWGVAGGSVRPLMGL